jgi:hypothetical protein
MARRLEVETKVCPACSIEFDVGGRGRPPRSQRCCSMECARRAKYVRGRKANELTVERAAYMAGYVDADGHFGIYGRYDGNASLSFRMGAGGTRPAVLQAFASWAGIGSVSRAYRSKNPKHSDFYQWIVRGDGAVSLARQLLPYLQTKRPRAELGIEFQERLREPRLKADRSWQESARQRMLAMNAKGITKNPEA